MAQELQYLTAKMVDTDCDKSIQKDISRLEIDKEFSTSKNNNKGKRRRRSSPSSNRIIPVNKKSDKGTASFQYAKQNLAQKHRFSLLRDLALYAIGITNEAPSFAKVHKRNLIQRCVLLVIPGLDIDLFGYNGFPQGFGSIQMTSVAENLNFFEDTFSELQLVSFPGEQESIYSLMKTLATKPFTKNEKKQKKEQLEKQKVYLPDLIMSVNQLGSQSYPFHPLTVGLPDDLRTVTPEGWVDTKLFEHGGSHTFAIDCEMCNSENGKILARVSIVDFNEYVILNEFVKPEAKVVDYLTKYSGITQELLDTAKYTLNDIQEKILQVISADDLLIGHSLENDLNILRLRHPKIVDTAIIYEHPRGPPYRSSLKYLTQQYLDRTIQSGSHDSIEDAKACLELVKLKLLKNAAFGKILDGESIFTVAEQHNKKAVILDYLKVQPFQNNYVQCTNDDSVIERVIKELDDTNLIIANLKEMQFEFGWSKLSHGLDEFPNSEGSTADIESTPEDFKTKFHKKLNSRLEKLYSSLPLNTLLIISSGYGDPRLMHQLQKRKRDFKTEYSNKEYKDVKTEWNSDDQRLLRDVVKKVRRGFCFITVKGQDGFDINAVVN